MSEENDTAQTQRDELITTFKEGGFTGPMTVSNACDLPVVYNIAGYGFNIYSWVRSGKLEILHAPGGKMLLTPENLADAIIRTTAERKAIESGTLVQTFAP